MLRQGKTDEELIQFLAHLSKTQTAAVWTHRETAAAEMRLEHWEAAVGHLLKAVKLSEKDAMSWENLGICFFNMGRLDSTRKAINRALAIDPTRTYSKVILSWVDMIVVSGSSRQSARTSRECRPHDLELLSEAYQQFKDAMRHLFKGAVSTSLESLEACGKAAARCTRNVIAAEKLLGDVAFLRLKLRGESHLESAKQEARQHYAKAIHLAPNRSCLYRNLCASPPTLVPSDVTSRCLEASLRLDGCGGAGCGDRGTGDVEDSIDAVQASWRAVGTHCKSRYALIRALMLDRKDFASWQALERLPSTSEDERAYCHGHVKQLHKEERDIFARILASKMDPESASSDLFSRMQVGELFGPELMAVYLSDTSNPMRHAVTELVNLLSSDTVVQDTTVDEEDTDDGDDNDDDDEREYQDDRKRRHELPWKFN